MGARERRVRQALATTLPIVWARLQSAGYRTGKLGPRTPRRAQEAPPERAWPGVGAPHSATQGEGTGRAAQRAWETRSAGPLARSTRVIFSAAMEADGRRY